ncbi:hypothetical protein ISF_03575 [Cordyceps fumosorosea ARSEF 2679]|uniref:Uncharacterized protein n=1 Tax=Cordyceps fumosorosea (strain ARSEF 2679) TaxID=1081104 RepID=A0A167ZE54_CORFA|nr:hypothetical protein ISF_03575 [Cordyceps fumosorosea ARSEF 2679]OAA67399.1 hypothetical protein ISF_03575 [Cordyceps fumosorosea ARSEF 2679]
MSTAATLQPTLIHHQKPISASSSSSSPIARLAAPSRKTMSVTQTYYLAHKARAKLSREAAQPDHDLRLLVGHANLLDSLMMELADAEREQERWFNQSVRSNTKKAAADKNSRHIQWADRIVEEAVEEDEYEANSSDSDSDDSDFDYEEEDPKVNTAVVVPTVTVQQVDADDIEEDLEEDYAQLELVRTPSHSSSGSPPELLIDQHDSDSSDDESMPPSPAEAPLPLPNAKEQQQAYREEEEYYSRRNATGLVSAIMVY